MTRDNTKMRPYPLGPLCPRHGFIYMRKRGRRWTCERGDYVVKYDQATYDLWKTTDTFEDVEKWLAETEV